MSMLAFDTHVQIKRLVQAGVAEPQAEAMVAAIVARDSGLPDPSQLATKADLDTQVLGLKADTALLRTELKSEIALSASRLEGQIKGLKGDLVWWVLGSLGVILVGQIAGQTLSHLIK